MQDVVLHLNMSVSSDINGTEMIKAVENALCIYCTATGQTIRLYHAHVMAEQRTSLNKILPLKEEQHYVGF